MDKNTTQTGPFIVQYGYYDHNKGGIMLSVREAKQSLSKYLNQVAYGKERHHS